MAEEEEEEDDDDEWRNHQFLILSASHNMK
jgi:hypothetical protein